MESIGLYVLLALSVLFLLRLIQFLRGHISPMPLAGKHVLIAGGSAGLGLELAKECCLKGALVTVFARGEERLMEARQQIEALNAGKILTLQADLARINQVKAVLDEAEKVFGPVYFFISCVGKTYTGSVEADMDLYRNSLEVNFLSLLSPVQLIAGRMKSTGGGVVCLVSDAAVILKTPGLAPTIPAKAALKSFADWIRPELRRYNISVHVFYPPVMNTDGYNEAKHRMSKVPLAYAHKPVSARQAALSLLSGVSVGESDIVADDTTMLYRSVSLTGGRRTLLPLDVVLAPVAVLIGHIRAVLMRWAVTKAKGRRGLTSYYPA